jgi:hypothetical protein
MSIKPGTLVIPNIVRLLAIKNISAQQVRSKSIPRPVRVAEKYSLEHPSRSVVPARVLCVSAVAKLLPVYNLTVEGSPEYFANGVLVHNCDAAAHAWAALGKPAASYAGTYTRAT